MVSKSGQKFIKRNRPPRVHIQYEDPHNADNLVELPFIVGVMADLSGNTPGVEKQPFGERKFRDIDMETFDDHMAAIKPGISYSVPDKLSDNPDQKLSVQLQFEKMDDFGPVAIARQVPALAKLLKAREELNNLMRYMDGKAAAEDRLQQLLSDPELMAALNERASKKQAEDAAASEADDNKERGEE